MTREDARQIIATWLVSSKGAKGQRGYIEGWFDEEDVEAFRMAAEALSVDALLKQEIDFHKKVSRIEAEKVVDLEHKLADMVSVVRCKDCIYWLQHEQFGFDEDNDEYHDYCALLVPDDDYYAYTRKADDFCSYGERREK